MPARLGAVVGTHILLDRRQGERDVERADRQARRGTPDKAEAAGAAIFFVLRGRTGIVLGMFSAGSSTWARSSAA